MQRAGHEGGAELAGAARTAGSPHRAGVCLTLKEGVSLSRRRCGGAVGIAEASGGGEEPGGGFEGWEEVL